MQPDSEHNGAMDPHIIGYLTMISTTAHKNISHSLATQTQHISSYITQGSQRHKYEIMRLNRIDLQTYCNVLLHAHSYQVEQDYSYPDQGPSCLDACKYMTCLGIASDMQDSEKKQPSFCECPWGDPHVHGILLGGRPAPPTSTSELPCAT